jgi:hypothetical protein
MFGSILRNCIPAPGNMIFNYESMKMNKIQKSAFCALIAVMVLTMITSTSIAVLVYASPTTEDDGYTYPDDASDEEKDEIDEQEQEAWEDAGRPGDDNDDDNNNNPNPYCDKVSDEYMQSGGVCHDRLDYDQDTGLYPCNDGTQAVDWRDCKDVSESNDDESGSNSNNIPECVNGVTQECVIEEIGLICSPGYDLSNPSIVGGGHACQDIYAGTYKPETPSNNDNDNSNSDNIPECKRDVLQECKLSGNTGLLCSVEDLTHGEYNPSVIGDGHACHDVYIGTYNQLEACKDGTYAVSCGNIGVLPGIP